MKKVVPLQNLITQFERLPGIGHKSAQRLAFHVLSMTDAQIEDFTAAVREAHSKIHRCEKCCDLTDDILCPVCDDPERDASTICVVENSRDVMAFERTHEYNGVYHVLHGVISPLNGVGPEDLTVKELIARLSDTSVKEVIMATNPTAEGEATAVFLARLIKPLGVEVSRLAYGVPVGADLEYADEFTLLKAMEGRQKI
ncbi:MAG: recombination mediator RecR [Acutalibacteraceae bacterium]